jgi:hypothetical protein
MIFCGKFCTYWKNRNFRYLGPISNLTTFLESSNFCDSNGLKFELKKLAFAELSKSKEKLQKNVFTQIYSNFRPFESQKLYDSKNVVRFEIGPR